MKSILLTALIIFTISVSAQVEKIRVACVGNSITEGSGLGTKTYPAQLGALLGNHYEVKNYGLGGRTLLKKGDYPYWNEEYFLDAQDYNPHIIILCLGTNDSKPQNWVYKDEFYSDYMEMVQTFRKNNRNPQIYVCFPTPVFKDGYGITNSIIHDNIIPLIDSVCKTANTLLINFNEGLKNYSTLFSDGIHPNADGYAIMAKIAYDSIMSSPSGIIRYFNANPATFEQGQSLKLYWETTTGSQVMLDGIPVNQTDSTEVSPITNTTYTLITDGEVKDTSYVTINFLPPGNIKTFYANPPIVERNSGESSELIWTTSNGSTALLDGESVLSNGSKTVTPTSTTSYKLIAGGGLTDTATVTIQVLDADKINRSLLASAFKASSTARGLTPNLAADDDTTTAWISNTGNTQWIYIDFGKTLYINSVVLKWGKIYGMVYHLETLTAAGVTKRIYTNNIGDGGVDDITGLTGEGRYIRLLCISSNNTDSSYVLNEFEVYGSSQPTDIISAEILPIKLELSQNYPNPFNPVTTIKFSIPSVGANCCSPVQLKVYDILGNEIATLVNEVKQPGNYVVEFDAAGLSTGIYFYRLRAGEISLINKMVLMK